MWRGILLLLLPVSQMRDSAALFIGECNPLLDFVSFIFSSNTCQNCMTTVKLRLSSLLYYVRPLGPMASDYESEDSMFESLRGRLFFFRVKNKMRSNNESGYFANVNVFFLSELREKLPSISQILKQN